MKRRCWSQEELVRMQKCGRGQGHGVNYKPWITVYDFPSKGKVTRIRGNTVNRIYHLLSSLERMAFILIDNDPNVIDIREQYPLPLKETLRIAHELKSKFPDRAHPCVNGFWYVMTTDFLIDTKDGMIAWTVKPKSFLDKPDVQWKFAIERRCWEEQGVPWSIITEDSLNKALSMNYQWLSFGEPLEILIPDSCERIHIKKAFLDYIMQYW